MDNFKQQFDSPFIIGSTSTITVSFFPTFQFNTFKHKKQINSAPIVTKLSFSNKINSPSSLDYDFKNLNLRFNFFFLKSSTSLLFLNCKQKSVYYSSIIYTNNQIAHQLSSIGFSKIIFKILIFFSQVKNKQSQSK